MRLENQLAANHHRRIGEEAQTIRPSKPPKAPTHPGRATGGNRVHPTASTAALALLGGSAAAATVYLIYASLSAVGTSLGKGELVANTPGGPLAIPFQDPAALLTHQPNPLDLFDQNATRLATNPRGHAKVPPPPTRTPKPTRAALTLPVDRPTTELNTKTIPPGRSWEETGPIDDVFHPHNPSPRSGFSLPEISESPLKMAILVKDAQGVRTLVTEHPELVEKNTLNFALWVSNPEIVSTLLDLNLNVNDHESLDPPPLETALYFNLPTEIIRRMIELGADKSDIFENGLQLRVDTLGLWTVFPRTGVPFPDAETLNYLRTLGTLSNLGVPIRSDQTIVPYTFDATSDGSPCQEYDTNAQSFSPDQQAGIRLTMQWIGNHTGLSFLETDTASDARLCWGIGKTPSYALAEAQFPIDYTTQSGRSRIFFNPEKIDLNSTFRPGEFNYLACFHEMGHQFPALTHPRDLYNENRATVMGYYNIPQFYFPSTLRPADLLIFRQWFGLGPIDRNREVNVIDNYGSDELIDSSRLNLSGLTDPVLWHTQNNWENSKASNVIGVTRGVDPYAYTRQSVSGMPDNPVTNLIGPSAPAIVHDAPVNQTFSFGCPALVRLGIGPEHNQTLDTLYGSQLHLEVLGAAHPWEGSTPVKLWTINSTEGFSVEIAGWPGHPGTTLQIQVSPSGFRSIALPNISFENADSLFRGIGNTLDFYQLPCTPSEPSNPSDTDIDTDILNIALPLALSGVALLGIVITIIVCRACKPKTAYAPVDIALRTLTSASDNDNENEATKTQAESPTNSGNDGTIITKPTALSDGSLTDRTEDDTIPEQGSSQV
ncbi:MAG: hypothetical protein AB7F28_04095 [Candidatus Margulisiibacteriota bacterium]